MRYNILRYCAHTDIGAALYVVAEGPLRACSVYHMPRPAITLQWRRNEPASVSNHQLAIVYSAVYSRADQRKQQSSASLAFLWEIHRSSMNSSHNNAENVSIWWRHRAILMVMDALGLIYEQWKT